ncbi:TetR/AcrR family transcriptional regulator [Anaerotignum sp. MB30-C6]|uniref:TetR/AcrR family transcriptional regulator n=1 Tax=Anaerotignum sp. MB30-C6 TaxID=3070814 RepID=UPI0027DAE9BF|nr:TetR/AcrR family transcriptional regulator [Anaerotignum sp. MB30-C6]WMI80024.1 TetR/AcrR family transcriptional regulator [Anaerotignum sp. MB30-C6]
MAKQIEGVYERIMACAQQEFLEKGYKDASLRVIAAKANTATGSIYTRFGDKESLFSAIVEPVVDEFMEMFRDVNQVFQSFDAETQKKSMHQYSSNSMTKMLDFIYQHFYVFKLLLDASYGTKFHKFMDEMIENEVESTYKYMEVIGCESVKSGIVTEDFIHIVVTSYFEGVFEVVRHDMSREEAVKYINMLRLYHLAGFETVFSPEKYR